MTSHQPNILIDNDGHARLTDFGFASVVRGLHSVLVTSVQGYTARWAAPEVLETGDKNTRAADVFAFAMVVTEVGPWASSSYSCFRSSEIYGSPDGKPSSRPLPEIIRSANSRPQSPFRRLWMVSGQTGHKNLVCPTRRGT